MTAGELLHAIVRFRVWPFDLPEKIVVLRENCFRPMTTWTRTGRRKGGAHVVDYVRDLYETDRRQQLSLAAPFSRSPSGQQSDSATRHRANVEISGLAQRNAGWPIDNALAILPSFTVLVPMPLLRLRNCCRQSASCASFLMLVRGPWTWNIALSISSKWHP